MQQTSASIASATDAVYPGRLRRFACMLYEGVLLFGVVFVAGYAFDTLTQSRDAMMWRHTRQFVVFLAIGVYFVLSWHRRGQTLPMKTWHIRLTTKSGAKPALPRLLARYILLWPLPVLSALLIHELSQRNGKEALDLLVVFTPFTVFIWTWFDPQRQFLHDRLLGTRLVDQRAAARH